MFFFVKQKTAYEVRISDWSSDVCSSDLRGLAGAVDADDPQHRVLRRDEGHVVDRHQPAEPLGEAADLEHQRCATRPNRPAGLRKITRIRIEKPTKIGRAPGRERV